MRKKIFSLIAFFILCTTPCFSFAAEAKFYYAGWLPFWKQMSGAVDILGNIEKLNEINPFSYEVKADGTLVDKLKIKEGFWPGMLSVARKAKIKVVPTIAWFDGDAIHALLTNKQKRIAHENAITKLVVDNKFDGIDIDYEAKLAETNAYFSLLIEGLAIRLHPKGKLLVCTIEPRMPDSSFREPLPKDTPRANNYAVLNKYCDQVRLMAYDQGTIDFQLNATKGNGTIYAPVADPLWVEKIIQEAVKTINPKKVLLGVPTYGYMYSVSWENNLLTYRRLRAMNFFPAMNLADELNISPTRTSAGELGFMYTTSTFAEVSSVLRSTVSSTLPQNVPSSIINASGSVMRYVTFSDAESVRQKIQLAKKYNLKGVALFKLDGEADPAIWEMMK